PVDGLETDRVEDRKRVAAEPLHRIGSLRHAGLAMAAPVVAHQAKLPGERLDLWAPHVERGGERVRQQECRRAFRALDLNMDRTAVGIDHRHDFPPCEFRYGRLLARPCSAPIWRSMKVWAAP